MRYLDTARASETTSALTTPERACRKSARRQVRTTEAFGIDAIVIAGRTPSERKAIRSFELFRGGLRDVRVFTFEELIGKTRALLDLLTAAPDAPPPPLKDEDLPF
jgi:hypothetical protein